MITTPNMGLIEWDLGSDPYDHAQLAANFNNIDLHDHSPGKGVRLGTSSFQDGSITSDKLADGSVTTSKIVNNAVTQSKLDPAILSALMPLGTVVSWWRQSVSTPIPTGWAIADGTAWSSINNDMGISAGNILDLRNSFILGAAVYGTGTDPNSPPAIGAIGGGQTTNLVHSHVVNGHAHSIQPHQHTVDPHYHVVSNHTHDMNHQHYLPNPIALGAHGDINIINPSSAFYSQIIDGRFNDIFEVFVNSGYSLLDVGAPSNTNNQFSGYATVTTPARFRNDVWNGPDMSQTGGSAPTTSLDGSLTNSVGLTTDNAGSSTNSALGSTDIRPKFTGLLYIMKVKY